MTTKNKYIISLSKQRAKVCVEAANMNGWAADGKLIIQYLQSPDSISDVLAGLLEFNTE
jgi:hypothetical protein